MIRVLSLGAGVQSTTLLLMSCLGELPLLDAAVFADTQWEPAEVYILKDWLAEYAAKAGIPVHTVTHRSIRSDLLKFKRSVKSGMDYTHVPLYVRAPDGKLGMLSRQCTSKYKIDPVDRFIKSKLLNLKPGADLPKAPQVEVWLGITWDEKQRAKPAPKDCPWKVHVHPFCCSPTPIADCFKWPAGGFRVWSRNDCLNWLRRNFPDLHVPRSACIGCPFRSNLEWRRIRGNSTAWADAILVDEAIRQQEKSALDGIPYLHRSGVPLAQADLDDEKAWDGITDNECLGMCGV